MVGTAKLRAPRHRRDLVERRRLVDRLARVRERRVILLCAPAGSGKTILAAQLSDRDPRPTGWIHLDDADNDPVALLEAVLGMLEQLGPLSPALLEELDARGGRLDPEMLPLLEEEIRFRVPFLLVLDDVGLISHPAAMAIIAGVLGALPVGAQLVLASRGEPDLPLGRLRAEGELVDVRVADLALDAAETRAVLEHGGAHVSEEQAEALRERAEGWPAGIALAAFSHQHPADANVLPTLAVGPSSDIAAYLLEEAVQRQPPAVQHFLLASSLLRRMSPELCDIALDTEGSEQMLAGLGRSSLFVVPLDGDGDWYRYHHLFRDLLRAELRRRSPELIPGILERAAVWHDTHGDPSAAFEYAHERGDLTHAGSVTLRHAEALIARGQTDTVRGWLRRCTPAELASDPTLALAGAWLALLTGDAAEARRLTVAAESAGDLDVASPDGATSLRSSLANLRATLATDGVGAMLRDGEYVVAVEEPVGSRWALDGWRAVGTAHLLDGRPEEAIAAFSEVVRRTQGRPELRHLTVNCLGHSSLAAADAGDWRRARKWAREAHALTTEGGLGRVLQGLASHTAHATVLLNDGLHRQAAEALAEAREVAPTVHALRWWEADISLRFADLSLGLGDLPGALDSADTARAALSHYPDAGRLPQRLAKLDARLRSGSDLKLTPSELRLVPFLASHLSLQEIGERVHLSRATVKTHTVSIYRKLDVQSRSAAVERLEELGFFQRRSAPGA